MKKKNVLLCIVVLTLIAVLAITLSACAKVSLTLNFIVDGKVYATVETDGQETIKMPSDPKNRMPHLKVGIGMKGLGLARSLPILCCKRPSQATLPCTQNSAQRKSP